MNLRDASPVRLVACTLLTVALTGCRPHDFPQFPPNYREYAYVTNGDSGTVTVLDVVNVRIDREVAVGQHPVAVAAGIARNEVYVVNSGAPGSQGRGGRVAARQPKHLMARVAQLTHDRRADEPGGPGHEHTHGDSLTISPTLSLIQ